MSTLSAAIKRDPLVAFFVLAFAISWIVWSPLAISRQEGSLGATLLITVGIFGPPLAALVVTWVVEGREGLRAWWRRIVAWRVDLRLYAVALLLPAALGFSAYGLYLLLGGAIPEGWRTPPWFSYIVLLLFIMLLGGGQEEPGWRGFAQPRLQARTSPLAASIIIGLLWALWHLPLFFTPASSQSGTQMPFPLYVPHTVALSVIFTWLFNSSRQSVLLVMLLHGGLNAITGWVPIQARGGPISLFVWLVLVEWVLAVVLIVTYGPGRLSRQASS